MADESVTNALEALVGTGKKFSTVEDLAKGKLEADTFIRVLEQQIADLKTETLTLQQRADRTEALEKIMTELKNSNGNPGNPEGVQPSDKSNQPQTLTHEDIVRLMEEREVAKRQEQNLASAVDELKKVYGTKTDEVLAAKASELGMTVEQLQALGRSSPQALVNLIGVSKQTSTRSATGGGSNSEALITSDNLGGEVRNKAYYDNLKKTMGIQKFVFDRNIQAQLHRDMSSLGDAWDTGAN